MKNIILAILTSLTIAFTIISCSHPKSAKSIQRLQLHSVILEDMAMERKHEAIGRQLIKLAMKENEENKKNGLPRKHKKSESNDNDDGCRCPEVAY